MNNELETKKYIVERNVISEELLNFGTQYALFDEMQSFKPEISLQGNIAQCPKAHSSYSDPFMETMLVNLQNIIEEKTELELFPTYSYYRVYRNGDILEPHTDRVACEYSVTLSFKYSYQGDPWPIYFDENEVVLNSGDIAIYKGNEISHWRNKLITTDTNDWHVQGFFHYVNANGPYANQKYDSKSSVGQIFPRFHKMMIRTKPYIQYL